MCHRVPRRSKGGTLRGGKGCSVGSPGHGRPPFTSERQRTPEGLAELRFGETDPGTDGQSVSHYQIKNGMKQKEGDDHEERTRRVNSIDHKNW